MSEYPIPRKNPDPGDEKSPEYPEDKNPESRGFFTREFYEIFKFKSRSPEVWDFRDFQDLYPDPRDSGISGIFGFSRI